MKARFTISPLQIVLYHHHQLTYNLIQMHNLQSICINFILVLKYVLDLSYATTGEHARLYKLVPRTDLYAPGGGMVWQAIPGKQFFNNDAI